MKRFQVNIKLITVLTVATIICLSTIYILFLVEGSPTQNNITLSKPTLVSPINKINVQSTPELIWTRVNGASTYELEIVSEKLAKIVFTKKGLSSSVLMYQFQPNEALSLGVYHWRVRAVNAAGKAGSWSDVGVFIVQ